MLGPELIRDGLLFEPDVDGFGKVIVQEKILDIDTGSPGSWCGQDVINKDFDGDQISNLGGGISWEFNEITPHCATDPIRVGLLFVVVSNNTDICGHGAFGDVTLVDETAGLSSRNSVCWVLVTGKSSGETSQLLAHGQLPSLAHGRLCEFLIFRVLVRVWVDSCANKVTVSQGWRCLWSG